MEGTERLLQGRFWVKVMVIEDVDVLDTKPPQALVEAGEKILSGSEVAVGPGPPVPARLGGDDEFVPVVPEVLAEDPSEIGLRTAVRGP